MTLPHARRWETHTGWWATFDGWGASDRGVSSPSSPPEVCTFPRRVLCTRNRESAPFTLLVRHPTIPRHHRFVARLDTENGGAVGRQAHLIYFSPTAGIWQPVQLASEVKAGPVPASYILTQTCYILIKRNKVVPEPPRQQWAPRSPTSTLST